MGLTIHYCLRLPNSASLPALLAAARDFATARGWPVHEFTLDHAERYRFDESRTWDYEGPVSGVAIQPDEYCDTFMLEVGTDLMACAAVKTEYAGSEVHREVVALLDALTPHLAEIEVHDESEFWETRDPSVLRKRMSTRDELMAERLARAAEPG